MQDQDQGQPYQSQSSIPLSKRGRVRTGIGNILLQSTEANAFLYRGLLRGQRERLRDRGTRCVLRCSIYFMFEMQEQAAVEGVCMCVACVKAGEFVIHLVH